MLPPPAPNLLHWRRFARIFPSNPTDRLESAMANYDPNNIFAKILRGELPSYKVFEDDKVFAFLDIMPRAPGHTLVVPKNPARTIIDITPDDLTYVMKATQRIARAALRLLPLMASRFSSSMRRQAVILAQIEHGLAQLGHRLGCWWACEIAHRVEAG